MDFSKKPFAVNLSDGSPSLRGLGLIVPSPELRSASVTGKINTEGMTGKLKNAVAERRLLAWAVGKGGDVVVIMSDDAVLETALIVKRANQMRLDANYVLDAKITPAVWDDMTTIALELMAEDDDSICEWWRSNASIHGDNAPWNKQMGGQNNRQRRSRSKTVGAAATPSVSPVNVAPLSEGQIVFLHNRFSRSHLNNKHIMSTEPVRFDVDNSVLYAKRTPFVPPGGEALATSETPGFLRDYLEEHSDDETEISEEIRKVKDRFVRGFAVISLDGKTYFQATEEEVQEKILEEEFEVEYCKKLKKKEVPPGTYRRMVNEKMKRRDAEARKRKASDTRASAAKVPRCPTEDSNSDSDDESDDGGEDDGDEMEHEDVRELIAVRFGQLIGSIGVFDVEDIDHTPAAEIPRFGPFRLFTAATAKDIHSILSGRKGRFEKKAFPDTDFPKPRPYAPDIKAVKRLYDLGLMVGSTWNNTLLCASDSTIRATLDTEGMGKVSVETYLEEVMDLMTNNNDGDEDGDTVQEDGDGYRSPADSGEVKK